ncbi:hypothetical protein NPIL_472791 [Nephila pilipes]|uniref:Uncharacterized protein n=1 Tax=Nephila pilipes TaxID=299642 RepID=A0A8X6QTS8_NEPPI|nr:hypothetical protein NPIL_472791 [Nephila pilipes]
MDLEDMEVEQDCQQQQQHASWMAVVRRVPRKGRFRGGGAGAGADMVSAVMSRRILRTSVDGGAESSLLLQQPSREQVNPPAEECRISGG